MEKLTNTEDLRWEELAKQEPIIKKAVDKLRIASLDPEAGMLYEAREDARYVMMHLKMEESKADKKEG